MAETNLFQPDLPLELLRRLEQMDNLPSSPDVVTNIIRLLNDPNADFRAIAADIEKDPALATKILKTANSALYARRREVTSISQALLVLGQSATATLALSFSLITTTNDRGASGIDLKFFWSRSLLNATAAWAFANTLNPDDKDIYFLGGLLQDIGLLVLDRVIPEHYQELGSSQTEHKTVCAHEITELGADHAWIGAWLLEKWGLPENICESVRYSHHLSAEMPDRHTQQFVDCTGLAGLISDVLLNNPPPDALTNLANQIQTRIGLDKATTIEILEAINAKIPEIESQFGMDILDVGVTANIIDQARQAMTTVSLNSQREIVALNQEINALDSKATALEIISNTDSLTGLRNREFLESQIKEWEARSKQFGFPVSLAFMDLDGFKDINDSISHASGDQVLKRTAEILSAQIGDTDILARYGGDEFVLLFGAESSESAREICVRLCNVYNNSRQSIDSVNIDVKISIGLATMSMSDTCTGKDLLRAADDALRAAKQRGKGCVVAYDELM